MNERPMFGRDFLTKIKRQLEVDITVVLLRILFFLVILFLLLDITSPETNINMSLKACAPEIHMRPTNKSISYRILNLSARNSHKHNPQMM